MKIGVHRVIADIYRGVLKSDHLKSRFFQICFQMVHFSKGGALANRAVVPTI